MANTNTNTDNSNLLSTDIYDVSAFLDKVREDTIPDLDETSSMVGIFGYMNEMFSQSLQNTLIATAETSNEAIPTRAKFTKNVINHAMNLSITDIYAKPATMTMMIYLPLNYVEQNLVEQNEQGRYKFILDKECPFNVDSYEFHLDYDVIITRIRSDATGGKYVYTAIYDLFEQGTANIRQANPISDITNPYITTLIQTNLNGTEYLAFSARLHQVTNDKVVKNILTNNSIENKTITFTFSDQLAAFDIDVLENNTITHLTPVYAGLLDNMLADGEWCYYEFLDEHTIRVLFDKNSYVPGLNSQVTVNIKICEGSNGNFTYTNNFRTSLRSEKYNNYNGMYAIVYPLMNGISNGGKDKKSVTDLRRIIPREASSRGAIINTTDLQNFFNSIDDYQSKLYFKKKRDNQFERMYYAYLVMRKDGYVYPTNTLDLKLKQENFKGFAGNNNLAIIPGTKFYYYNHGTNVDNNYATIVPPVYEEGLDEDLYPHPMTVNEDGDLVRVFEYITPFLITIDDDLITSYLMTLINENKTFKFLSINTSSDLQFIATNMNWSRKFIIEGSDEVYDNKYTMDMDIVQNNNTNYNLVTVVTDANGIETYTDIRIKVIMVLYTDDTDTTPYRYCEAELVDYNNKSLMYSFRFTLETNDLMDLNNRINITGIYNAKPESFQPNSVLNNSHGYMNKNTYAKVFILADFGTKPGDRLSDNTVITEDTAEVIVYGDDGIGNRTELENLIPKRDDIVDSFLGNNIYLDKNGVRTSVVTIMRSNPEYMAKVTAYNNDTQETELAIIRYLRNNKDSDFVQNILLKDNDVIEVINSYNFIDLSRYTVCNVMAVDGGIDFYHDYSAMMRSTVNIKAVQKTDSSGHPIYQEIVRTDAMGIEYTEYKPIYLINDNNTHVYDYTLSRVPMIKSGYLNTEEAMQDYIYTLDERRKYINECLYVLEDTFDIDLKFFNTYGPSRMFYYNIPSSQNYKVRVITKQLKVLSSTIDEDDESALVGTLSFGDYVNITKVKGQWGLINSPYEGWIKLSDTTRLVSYIDNVALTFKFALEAESSADKYITDNIISDIKEYVEDINVINELHIPNIITLITNNYREQLVYFEYLDVNGYGNACQHLYLDEKVDADICPEFLNIETKMDGAAVPEIEITVY